MLWRGRREQAEQIISELKGLTNGRYVSSYYFAMIYLGLGDVNQALSFLEAALLERTGFMAFIKVEPMLDSLRSNPRFADIERSVGLAG